MNQKFQKILALLVEQETVEVEYSPDLLAQYQNDIVKLGKKYPQDVWEVLRNGTENEFSALINCVAEIGGEFDDENNSREIMYIAKQRLLNAQNHEDFMATIKAGFGNLFARFWNETEPAKSAVKTRMYSQAIQPPV